MNTPEHPALPEMPSREEIDALIQQAQRERAAAIRSFVLALFRRTKSSDALHAAHQGA